MKRVNIITMLVITLIANVFTGIVYGAPQNTSEIDYKRTFYVSNNGDDENSGLTPKEAWKTVEKVNREKFEPGDEILFDANGVWTATNETKGTSFLRPRGSGTEEEPIRIGKYGSDDYQKRPIFNGLGKVKNTVHIENVNHYIVENLEVTNYDEAGTTIHDTTKELVGIFVENSGIDTYTMSDITVQDCYVHDINARYSKRFNNDGGIIIRVTKAAENTTDKALNFDGVYIRRNTIYNVDYGGIFFRNDNQNRGPMYEGIAPWIGSPNIIIENNSIDKVAGDGIVVSTGIKPLIQYNVVKDSHLKCPDPSAAIWVINGVDALLQYNEAYLTRQDSDGQAYDADGLCENTIFQYNYSHDNEGGFMLICNWHGGGAFNKNGIIRYNISQNDRSKLIHYSGINTGFEVYNNTFFVGPGNNTAFSRDHGPANVSDVEYTNNIFYNLGTDFSYEHHLTNVSFNNNIYFGNHPASEPYDPNKIIVDPKLYAPGTGSTLMEMTVESKDENRAIGWDELVNDRLKGYKLMPDSPAINAGIPVELPEDIPHATKDFFGNPLVGGIDIGAHQYSNDTPAPILEGTSWSFKDDYSNVSGENNWHYLRFKNNQPLVTTFDSPDSVRTDKDGEPMEPVWRGRQWEAELYHPDVAFISKDEISVSSDQDMGIGFLAPRDGVFNILGNIKKAILGKDVSVAIQLNERTIWGPHTINGEDIVQSQNHNFNVDLNQGDAIYFIVKSNGSNGDIVNWEPKVTYIEEKFGRPELTAGSYFLDDTSPRISYDNMEAKTYLSENDAYYKTHHISKQTEKGTLELDYVGSGIEFIGQRSPKNGNLNVKLYKGKELIDDITIDTVASAIANRASIYKKEKLDYGAYKIVIENLGSRMVVDGFIIDTLGADGIHDLVNLNSEYDTKLISLDFKNELDELVYDTSKIIKGTNLKVNAVVLNPQYYVSGFIINGKAVSGNNYIIENIQEDIDLKVILSSYDLTPGTKLDLSNTDVESNNCIDDTKHQPETSFDGITKDHVGGWAVKQKTFPVKPGVEKPYIQVKLPKETFINKVKVYFDGDKDYRGGTYDVQVSMDGEKFTDAYKQKTTISTSINEHIFSPVKANYVRLIINSHAISNSENGNFILNEMEIYEAPEIATDKSILNDLILVAKEIKLDGKLEYRVIVFKEKLAIAELFAADEYVSQDKINQAIADLQEAMKYLDVAQDDIVKIKGDYDPAVVRLQFEDGDGNIIKNSDKIIKGTDVTIHATTLDDQHYVVGLIVDGQPRLGNEYQVKNIQKDVDLKVILNRYTTKLDLSNAEVTSNNSMNDKSHLPKTSFDGINHDDHNGWAIKQGTFPLGENEEKPYIQVKLPDNSSINKVKVYFIGELDYRGGTYDVQVSEDGENFTSVYKQETKITEKINEHEFDNTRANYVRLVVDSHAVDNPANGNFILNELEIFTLPELTTDESRLEEAISRAEALDLNGKPENEISILKERLAIAKLFIGDIYASQEKIDRLTDELNEAIKNLDETDNIMITVKDTSNGSLIVMTDTGDRIQGTAELAKGVNITINPEASEDYILKYLLINGERIEADSSYELRNIEEDIVIGAIFAPSNDDYKLSISGVDTVRVGESVEVEVAINTVALPVYAQDLTVEYDEDILIFEEATSIDEFVEIVEVIKEKNKVRIISMTEGGTQGDLALIKLRFEAKNLANNTHTLISLSDVELGVIHEGESFTETAAGDVLSLLIQANEDALDKVALSKVIAEVKEILRNAIAGEEPGNYPNQAVKLFEKALSDAVEIRDSAIEQGEIDKAQSDLINAINIFEKSQIPADESSDLIPEDINGDGKVDIEDLAVISYYYCSTNKDENWESAKKADANEDGKIDVLDLVIIATKILR